MTGQIIIVTGPDRCGKTTLVNKLNNLVESRKKLIVHFSKPPASVIDPTEWSYNHYAECIYKFNQLVKEDWTIICDRFYEGEFVYGSRYREFPKDMFWKLEKYFINPKVTKLIVMTDDPVNIMARDDSQSHETSVNEYYTTSDLFWDFYNTTSITHKAICRLPEVTDEFLYEFIKL